MNAKVIRNLITAVLAAAILAGCALPTAPTPIVNTPSSDTIATQVAAILTATALVQPPTAAVVATATQPAAIPTATIQPTLEPTATTAPTATPPPTSTPTTAPTATAVKDDPRSVLGSPTFSDKTFKENANWGPAWENDYTKGEFEDNQLALTSVGVDGWTVSWPKVTDFYIEATITTGECAGSDRYGVIVRVPASFESGYMAGLTCDGRYSLRYWDADNSTYVYLIGWTSNSAIKAGSNQTNRLGLWSEGDTFKVYVNGQLVGEAKDTKFDEEGRLGLWIGHGDTEDFTVYFSEVSYWELP